MDSGFCIDCHCNFNILILSCDSETFPEVSQVGFSLLVDPTWTLLGYVSCMITQKLAVEI